MFKSFREWFSIRLAKNPGQIVLLAILFFNIAFLFLSAFIISSMSLSGTEQLGFLEAAYYTVTMILDAGCVSYVVEDIGPSNAVIAVICLIIVIIGMVSFTGAVIGYITNYISGFIENSNQGNRKLYLSGHFVILNWNSRALEIVNDLLYSETISKVIVLVNSGKEDVKREISECLCETVKRENDKAAERSRSMSFIAGRIYRAKHKFKNRLTVIVREGDVFSTKQLYDISLDMAASVVILGSENDNTDADRYLNGNSLTIKTLMQVSDITSSGSSADNQRIIVEVTDDWTWNLVQKIIRCKQVDGKCNIVPIRVNRILGQLMSQFSLMPELNTVYNELLSNRGATFYSTVSSVADETEFISGSLKKNRHIVPLTVQRNGSADHCFYMAYNEKDIEAADNIEEPSFKADINRDYRIEKKNIIMLGHNSKCRDIMDGFRAFLAEWGYKDSDEKLLQIIVIDDEKSLERMDHYRDYPFVCSTVAAEIFDKDLICRSINDFMEMNDEDVSVLILSDDLASGGETDADTLANLIYVQDIINDKKEANPDFDVESIDVIAEINDPKNHDVVSSYSVKNVIISNRYISKMITQIGEKDAIFDFFQDILTYDEDDSDGYESKEVYIKKAKDFFDTLPGPCTSDELIRAVFEASYDPGLPKEQQNITLMLGYVKPGNNVTLFSGDQKDISVSLGKNDKVIVFSNH
ncbi:MAG: hypothetical protein J5685_02155 [Clostridiales bacterium]|nr:hypothetical protein [Clostridiales bacterium]